MNHFPRRINKVCLTSLIAWVFFFTPLPLQADEAAGPAPVKEKIITLSPMIIAASLDESGEKILGTRKAQNEQTEIGTGVTAEQVFGRQGGLFHPYLSLTGEWTDNIYNIDRDEQSGLLTTVSPGIWFGYPRLNEIPPGLTPHNTAVGGSRFSSSGSSSFDRFQAYVLGGLDYKSYSDNADLNYTAWRMEGLFRYNMPVGMSFQIQDRLTRDRDRFDLGSFTPEDFSIAGGDVFLVSTPSRIRNYYSNLARLAVMLNISENYSLLFHYYNFYLDYDDAVNEWLNRTDNRYSLNLNYTFSPKTSFFLEYSFADVRYETDTLNNGSDNFYYGGIKWNGTAKTTLTAKGGYQVKESDAPGLEDYGTFSMEMMLSYLMTDKTKLTMGMYKALEESDSITSSGKDTVVARIRYDQNLSLRLKGNVELWYEISDYQGFTGTAIEGFADNRDDKDFQVRPGVQYIFRDWLMAELAYSFENRNSTDNLFDFTTQTIFLSLNATL